MMSMDEYERLVNLNVAEFQRFSDRVGAKAQEAGMTEEVLQELLGTSDKTLHEPHCRQNHDGRKEHDIAST